MTTFKLPYGQKVSPAFKAALFRVCKQLGWAADHAGWLMGCMAFESAGTFSSNIKNAAGSGAVGLIQFMPATAVALGTTTTALAAMAPEKQLDYVARYFMPYAGRINSLADMYMAILMPKYVGAPDSSVVFSGGAGYRQNSGFDTNKDGVITKIEATQLVSATYMKGFTTATDETSF